MNMNKIKAFITAVAAGILMACHPAPAMASERQQLCVQVAIYADLARQSIIAGESTLLELRRETNRAGHSEGVRVIMQETLTYTNKNIMQPREMFMEAVYNNCTRKVTL
jgi:hypothetical protein